MSDGFNQDKFIAAAKAAGYSDEEINAEIGRQTSQINAATGKEFGKASEEAVQGQSQQWRDQGLPVPGTKEPADTRSLTTQALDWAKTPSGNAVLGGLGLLGLGYAGYQGLKGPSSTGGAAQRVEPTLSDKPLSPAERTIGGPAQTDIPAYLRKQQAAPATPAAPTVPETPTMSAEQAAARVAEMPGHPNPITKIEPSTLTQVGSSETAKITKEVTDQQKKIKGKAGAAVEPKALTEATELKTGTGKPAFQGMNPEGKLQKSYGSIAEVPANMAFVPGAQYVDVLRNDLSQPTYTEQFRTKEWPSVYEKAIEEAKSINRSLGRETRAALLAKGVPKEELPKPTEGIFQKIGGKHGSKAVTVGGAIGALTAIPNLVHAAQGAQEKDVQKSFGSLMQGAGQFLGPLGAIAGDIFGISPEELETIRKAEQARKVGAGRGIAPPSSYQQ